MKSLSTLAAVILALYGCADERGSVVHEAPEHHPAPVDEPGPRRSEAASHVTPATSEAEPIGSASVDPHPDPTTAEPTQLFVTPDDGMTSVGVTRPSLTVISHPGPMDSSEQLEWSRRIRLSSWPERAAIDFDLTYVAPMSPSSSEHRFVLTPEAQLQPRWYVIDVNVGTSRVEVLNGTRRAGHLLSRFRPDSHPTVERVLIHRETPSAFVEIWFTENLVVGLDAVRLLGNGEPLPCEDQNPALEPRRRVRLICQSLPTGHIAVEVATSLATIEGTGLLDVAGETLESIGVDVGPMELPEDAASHWVAREALDRVEEGRLGL